MTKYSAVLEYISRREAVVTLFDESGEWAGSQRVTVRAHLGHSAVYELGYQYASLSARGKGGTLDRYAVEGTEGQAVACSARVTTAVERRPGNALNLEIGQPTPRCIDKRPAHWGENGPSALRWLASGGSPFVLGPCSSDCPRRMDL